jgi:hypothetical protein
MLLLAGNGGKLAILPLDMASLTVASGGFKNNQRSPGLPLSELLPFAAFRTIPISLSS